MSDYILYEVSDEVFEQVQTWGVQNHPDGTGPDVKWLENLNSDSTSEKNVSCNSTASQVRDFIRNTTDNQARLGKLTYRDILFEEVAEAFAEEDPSKLREELVQVAAVVVSWIGKIDRLVYGINA